MSPEKLALIKEHIKNPPSASLNRDWMLELVEEVERLSGAPVLADVLPADHPSSFKAVFAEDTAHAAALAAIGSRPTPPEPARAEVKKKVVKK